MEIKYNCLHSYNPLTSTKLARENKRLDVLKIIHIPGTIHHLYGDWCMVMIAVWITIHRDVVRYLAVHLDDLDVRVWSKVW